MRMQQLLVTLATLLACGLALAAPPQLSVAWRGAASSALKVDGQTLPGVTARLELLDPRTGKPVAPGKFTLQVKPQSKGGTVTLAGVVTAAGTADTVADLVLRVEGVALATGNGVEDLMLAARHVNKLPLAPLRTLANDQDQLCLAVPADQPVVYEFRPLPAEKSVLMRLPLGFTKDARPELRMRAPFALVLLPTEPRWHFRSALAAYYRLFPAQFNRVEKRDGGWFFANEVKNIPNPQHFAFFEGLSDPQECHDKGLGMYPYSETSSETIHLPGPGLPKDYDEAIRQLEALESARSPQAWEASGGGLDDTIKRGGQFAYRTTADRPASSYLRQTRDLKPPIPEPVVIEGWSKAENVSDDGNPSNYSIYVDCLLQDGSYQFGQCAVFRPGTHDWEKATFTIQPRLPLADLRVYLMFRGRTGTVWFDDVRIYRQSKPQENLLTNGDLETLGKRADIQYCRDNALTDAQDRLRFVITDNLAADVPPEVPLSLLRFACNVDPDWKAPEGRPTPCQRATEMFDNLFANTDIDGAYIDSVCAWCVWYLNFRRDHWPAATSPFTYDAATFKVAQAGKLAMVKYLRYIGARYHPRGKTIFGNMGPSVDAWDNYPVLDIIGIESSIFQDRALMGYHRYGGYHKPVLPMNFVNLHKLDDRATAEEFVLASAQWGEFPSTGRFVREGYESYGDVCHSYYPALLEMSRAGWEPEPLATGCHAERFGSKDVLYFTVRAPQAARQATLTIQPQALAGVKNPVVMDAVQLTPVPSRQTTQGLAVDLTDGADVLTILRVSTAANAREWLLQRVAHHCENAARVRGKTAATAPLLDLARRARTLQPTGDEAVGGVVADLRAQVDRVRQGPSDLERLSEERELQDALRALGEWLLYAGGAKLDLSGAALLPVSQTAEVQAQFTAGTSGARVLGTWTAPGRNILRLTDTNLLPAALDARPVTATSPLPGAVQVRTALRVPVPGGAPLTVIRARNVYFTPVVTAKVERQGDAARQAMAYTVKVERLAGPMPLRVRATGEKVTLEPAEVTLGAEESAATFRATAAGNSNEVVKVHFAVLTAAGQQLAATQAEFRVLPIPPPGNLALASAGATVASDSSYSEYTPTVTTDGVWETTGLHWTKAAWASADAAVKDGHWLEIKLPRPVPVSKLWVYWAIDSNSVFSARNVDVEVPDGAGWKVVASVRDNPPSTVTQLTWPAVTTDRVRLHQLKDGGPAQRPNIMWVGEVCLY